MNKTDLVDIISERADLSKAAAARALNATLEAISDELSGDGQVAIVGFGTFQVRSRAARNGRNPQTGKSIEIAASNSVGFKPGKALKDAVNK